jgi:hypothetical protein
LTLSRLAIETAFDTDSNDRRAGLGPPEQCAKRQLAFASLANMVARDQWIDCKTGRDAQELRVFALQSCEYRSIMFIDMLLVVSFRSLITDLLLAACRCPVLEQNPAAGLSS